jgi:ABC-2 type transport system ATP-binding protein
VIDHGKVIAEGTPGPAQGLGRAQGALEVRLLDPGAARRGRAGPAARDRDGAPRAGSRPPTAPCADADQAALAVAELSRSGVGHRGFALGQPSLDEVFLALTGHHAEEPADEAWLEDAA